jgi:hypothetical protein
MEIRKGIIRGFEGSWGSGIGLLVVEDYETEVVERVRCENAQTVRSLEGAFGNVIGEGHSVSSNPGFMNQEIFWSMDDMGLILGGFTPVDEASEELLEYFENQD